MCSWIADRRIVRGPGVRVFAASIGAAATLMPLALAADAGTLLHGVTFAYFQAVLTLMAVWGAVPAALLAMMLALWAERRAGAFRRR